MADAAKCEAGDVTPIRSLDELKGLDVGGFGNKGYTLYASAQPQAIYEVLKMMNFYDSTPVEKTDGRKIPVGSSRRMAKDRGDLTEFFDCSGLNGTGSSFSVPMQTEVVIFYAGKTDTPLRFVRSLLTRGHRVILSPLDPNHQNGNGAGRRLYLCEAKGSGYHVREILVKS